MTEEITPDIALPACSIALPVPGGIIRMTHGSGLSVEPGPTPSVEHPHEGLTCAEVETELVRLNQAVPSAEQIAERVTVWMGDERSAQALGEEIRALFAGRAPEGSTVAALLDARRSKIATLEAEVGRLTALAENKQTVIDEDRADAQRNRELWAEAAYANGEEITRLRAVVEAAEGRIDALLKVDAAVADLREAQADVEAAEEAIEVATDLDLEAAKALNAAKAKYAMQASTDPWAERDAEVPQ